MGVSLVRTLRMPEMSATTSEPASPPAKRTAQGYRPQRFSSNYARYRASGGGIDIEEDLRVATTANGRVPDAERFWFLTLAFDQIQKEGLPGDVAELGVYQGQTATMLARNARRLGRTTWLLDTFTGFDARDWAGTNADGTRLFSDTSLEAVRARVGTDRTRYVRGFFPESAAGLPADGRYCLVNIDCDLYAPIMRALEYFYPRMVPGGFLVVHDYSSLCWPGAEKAVDQFFADKPECVVPMPDSGGSALIRRQRAPDQRTTWLHGRQSLPVGEWLGAGEGGPLTHAFVTGWSRQEAWGIWGVRDSHLLACMPVDPDLSDFVIDLDVNVPLHPADQRSFVDVLVAGEPAGRWEFTRNANRAVRHLAVTRPADGRPVMVEFRPQAVLSARDIDPAAKDTRPLGMAVHRLRLRPAG
jgi:hypothetical protein